MLKSPVRFLLVLGCNIIESEVVAVRTNLDHLIRLGVALAPLEPFDRHLDDSETNLARLLARRVDGISRSDFEQGEIGPDLFRHACLIGLEGLVSKHRESAYRAGRFDRWVKVKNRQHPAFSRVMDQF